MGPHQLPDLLHVNSPKKAQHENPFFIGQIQTIQEIRQGGRRLLAGHLLPQK